MTPVSHYAHFDRTLGSFPLSTSSLIMTTACNHARRDMASVSFRQQKTQKLGTHLTCWLHAVSGASRVFAVDFLRTSTKLSPIKLSWYFCPVSLYLMESPSLPIALPVAFTASFVASMLCLSPQTSSFGCVCVRLMLRGKYA